MDDAGAGRDYPQLLECLLCPLQELVAFFVALHFQHLVALHGIRHAAEIDLDGVVHYQVHRDERFSLLWINAPACQSCPEGSQVVQYRNAGKILHQYPPGVEFHCLTICLLRLPACQSLNVSEGDILPVTMHQQILEQQADGVRQHLQVFPAQSRNLLQRMEQVNFPIHFQGGQRVKRVREDRCHRFIRQGVVLLPQRMRWLRQADWVTIRAAGRR